MGAGISLFRLFFLIGLGCLGGFFRFFGFFHPGVSLAGFFLFGFGCSGISLFGFFGFGGLLNPGVPSDETALFRPGPFAIFGLGLSGRRRRGRLCFGRSRRRGTFDADFERTFDLGVQVQFHFIVAQRANRVFEMNLLFVE